MVLAEEEVLVLAEAFHHQHKVLLEELVKAEALIVEAEAVAQDLLAQQELLVVTVETDYLLASQEVR